jgi:hypothetical protein
MRKQIFFLVCWYRDSCKYAYCFFEVVSFKSCEENNSIQIIQNHLGAFAKYVHEICTYTENRRKKSVHILRIDGRNLFIYWEYAEGTKSWISRRVGNQDQKYFRTFLRSPGWFGLAKSFKTKKSHASVTLSKEDDILRLWHICDK